MIQTTISPDGLYYWDGAKWRSTLSSDGAWRWSGTAWLAIGESKVTVQSAERYSSSRSLALWVNLLLGANVVIVLVSTFVFEFYFNFSVALGNQEVIYSIDLGALVVFAITAALFLLWLRRSHLNLAVLGVKDLKFSSDWVIGWWFVPVACCWMPYRVVAEVWRASGEPTSATSPAQSIPDGGHPALLVFWWVTWVVSSASVNVASLLVYPDGVQYLLFLFSAAATTVSAVLAIVVVWSVTAIQAARWRQLQSTVAMHDAEAALMGVPENAGTSPVASATGNSAREELTGIGWHPQP